MPATSTSSGKREPLSRQAQANNKKALDQQSVLTKQISESARTLGFGVIASCYALLLANKELAAQFDSARPALLLAAALGTAAITLDTAQYVFGYINVRKALKRTDRLFPNDWSKSARQICFIAKQLFAYGAALLLLVVIGTRVI
jgi:hypothetical protein